MSTPVGGLRLRLLRDSVEYMINNALDDLGWFDSGRQHDPVTIISAPSDWDEPIEFNSIAISLLEASDEDAEMGSNLTNDRHKCWIDIYAQSRDVADHLAGDIRDILRGKMPSIGRTGPVMDLMDLRLATPVSLATVLIEDVRKDRPENPPNVWQKHMVMVSCELEDSYQDEDDV